MDTGAIIKWGALILAGIFLLRWINNAIPTASAMEYGGSYGPIYGGGRLAGVQVGVFPVRGNYPYPERHRHDR